MSAHHNRRGRLRKEELRSLADRADLLRDRLFKIFAILKCCHRASRVRKRPLEPDFIVDTLSTASEMAYCGGIEAGLIVEGLTGCPLPMRPEIAELRRRLRRHKAGRKDGARLKRSATS